MERPLAKIRERVLKGKHQTYPGKIKDKYKINVLELTDERRNEFINTFQNMVVRNPDGTVNLALTGRLVRFVTQTLDLRPEDEQPLHRQGNFRNAMNPFRPPREDFTQMPTNILQGSLVVPNPLVPMAMRAHVLDRVLGHFTQKDPSDELQIMIAESFGRASYHQRLKFTNQILADVRRDTEKKFNLDRNALLEIVNAIQTEAMPLLQDLPVTQQLRQERNTFQRETRPTKEQIKLSEMEEKRERAIYEQALKEEDDDDFAVRRRERQLKIERERALDRMLDDEHTAMLLQRNQQAENQDVEDGDVFMMNFFNAQNLPEEIIDDEPDAGPVLEQEVLNLYRNVYEDWFQRLRGTPQGFEDLTFHLAEEMRQHVVQRRFGEGRAHLYERRYFNRLEQMRENFNQDMEMENLRNRFANMIHHRVTNNHFRFYVNRINEIENEQREQLEEDEEFEGMEIPDYPRELELIPRYGVARNYMRERQEFELRRAARLGAIVLEEESGEYDPNVQEEIRMNMQHQIHNANHIFEFGAPGDDDDNHE